MHPKKRISTEVALHHQWFTTEPYPLEPSQMKVFTGSIETYYDQYVKENIIQVPEDDISHHQINPINQGNQMGHQERHNRSHSREYQRNQNHHYNQQH